MAKRHNKSRQSARAEAAAPPRPLSQGMLGRILAYADKMFGMGDALGEIRDKRVRPRVAAGRVARSFLLLLLSRLGSLNALEQRKSPGTYTRWLGGELPSADVMADSLAGLDLAALRELLHHQHARLKRNKGFPRGKDGLRFLIVDGHEGVSSYKRTWKGCLERIVHFAKGDKTQYYHRHAAAYLTNGERFLMLDAEGQLPGEGEIACAMRLLERIFERYPRAFDVVCGDNLYMDPSLWKLVRSHKKHIIAVLKNENRDLLVDARSLFEGSAPVSMNDRKNRRCWDLKGFTTWPQCGEAVRVVRTLEEITIKRQEDGREETCISEWFWVTSLSPKQASTQCIVRAGHGRWGIENQGFNELGNQWHGDHGYKYNAHAIMAATLLLFIAYNLFHAFITQNLKPELKAGRTQKYWADLIAAEFIILFHAPTAPT